MQQSKCRIFVHSIHTLHMHHNGLNRHSSDDSNETKQWMDDGAEEWNVSANKSEPQFCWERFRWSVHSPCDTMAQLQMDHYNSRTLVTRYQNRFNPLECRLFFFFFFFFLYSVVFVVFSIFHNCRQSSMDACCLLFLVHFWLIRLDNYQIRSFIRFGHVNCVNGEPNLASVSHHTTLNSPQSSRQIRFFFFFGRQQNASIASHFICRMLFDCSAGWLTDWMAGWLRFANIFIAYWHKKIDSCVRVFVGTMSFTLAIWSHTHRTRW